MSSSSWHIQALSLCLLLKEGMNKTKNDFNVCLGLALSNLWVSAAVGDRELGIYFSHAIYLHLPRMVPGWWIRCLKGLGFGLT